MDNDVQVDKIIDNSQKDFLNNEKSKISEAVSALEAKLDEKYNEILAEIIGKDPSEITEADYVGDKLDYIKYISKNETISKKIDSTKSKFEKDKKEVKDHATDLLKFKARIFTSNQTVLAELENDIKERKKRKTKLNLNIKENLKEFQSTYLNIQSLKNIQNTLNDLNEKIKTAKESINKIYLSIGITSDNPTTEELAKISPEDKNKLDIHNQDIVNWTTVYNSILANTPHTNSIDELSNSIKQNEDKKNDLETKLISDRQEFEDLDIEKKEKSLDKAKEANLELFNSIENDIADYNKRGLEINPEDVKIDKSDSKGQIDNEHTSNDNKQNAPDKQTQQARNAGNSEPAQAQPQTQTQQNNSNDKMPVPLSDKKMAQNLKSDLLGNSAKDVNTMLDNGKTADLISSLPYLSRADKKVITERLEKLNTPLDNKDFTKLKNIVESLSECGMCEKLDLKQFIYSNGKFVDFSNITPKDITGLNNFINSIEQNKDIIDEEQLAFLKNNFFNNARSRMLADIVRPKSLREIIRNSFSTKYTNKQSDARSLDMLNNMHSISVAATPTPKVENRNSFYNNLIGQTYESINPPPTPTKQKGTDTPTR